MAQPGEETQGKVGGSLNGLREGEVIPSPPVLSALGTFLPPQLLITADTGVGCWCGEMDTRSRWRVGSSLQDSCNHSHLKITRTLTVSQRVPMQIDLESMKITCKCIFGCQKPCRLTILARVYRSKVLPPLHFS